MEDEILQLRAQLDEQRIRCAVLENELDDLAMDNDRLRKLLAANGVSSDFSKRNVTSHSLSAAAETATSHANSDWRELLVDGDDIFADTVLSKIDNSCGGMNVLCVNFCTYSDSETGDNDREVIACAGVDKTVWIYESPSATDRNATPLQVLKKYTLSAPVLSMDSCAPYLACSLMDGGHAVINLSASSTSNIPSVVTFKDHVKYVVAIKWSPDGVFLATVSHDKTVNLYKKSIASSGEISFIKVHTARFMVTPECAVFVKSSTVTRSIIPDRSADSGMIDGSAVIGDMADIRLEEKAAESAEENASNDDEWELIIGLRDTAHLTYLHCSTYAQRFVSLNEADWDTHCSFTPLYMVVSPDRKYLLISTDKNLMFMVKIGTSKRLRIFAGGHSCGDYGKPSASFESTGKYVYCNNEEGCSVCVYSVGSEKPVKFLAAHSGSVRGVTCHPSRALLATASYDKSVILWTASAR